MTYTFTQFVQLFCNVVRDVATKKKSFEELCKQTTRCTTPVLHKTT